jgi:hypothetical protein
VALVPQCAALLLLVQVLSLFGRRPDYGLAWQSGGFRLPGSDAAAPDTQQLSGLAVDGEDLLAAYTAGGRLVVARLAGLVGAIQRANATGEPLPVPQAQVPVCARCMPGQMVGQEAALREVFATRNCHPPPQLSAPTLSMVMRVALMQAEQVPILRMEAALRNNPRLAEVAMALTTRWGM